MTREESKDRSKRHDWHAIAQSSGAFKSEGMRNKEEEQAQRMAKQTKMVKNMQTQ